MNRRAVGWLLFFGSPGIAAGITLTLFFAISGSGRVPWPIPDLVAFGLWGAAAVSSAVGAYLIPPETASKETRFLVAVAGLFFGAVVFFAAMATADLLTPSF